MMAKFVSSISDTSAIFLAKKLVFRRPSYLPITKLLSFVTKIHFPTYLYPKIVKAMEPASYHLFGGGAGFAFLGGNKHVWNCRLDRL